MADDDLDSDLDLDVRLQRPTRVKVLAPFSVCHAGVAYPPDAIAVVPESVAAHWILNQWVVADDTAPARRPSK
jgi:hypothetical protein